MSSSRTRRNKRKRLNLQEKIDIIKTNEPENLSVRILAE